MNRHVKRHNGDSPRGGGGGGVVLDMTKGGAEWSALEVVGLADVQGVPEHQLAEAPQRVRHGAVGSLALQPVARQPALLLFGQVGVSPLRCGRKSGEEKKRVGQK